MHAAFEAIEQPRARQRPATGTHCTQTLGLPRLALQPADMLATHRTLDTDTTTDDHRVYRCSLVHCRIRGDLQAVTGPYLTAIGAERGPSVQLAPGQLVGHAQRFNRRGQGDEGEVVQQQEADGLRAANLGLSAGGDGRHCGISLREADGGLRQALVITLCLTGALHCYANAMPTMGRELHSA